MEQKLKVCGITQVTQVKQLDNLNVEFIGFIHYQKSPRNVSLAQLKQLNIKTKANKVLVTVNESLTHILKLANALQTKFLQLHGNETPAFCETLKNKGFTIIKAFGINEVFDFKILNAYKNCVDYFLFDYKGIQPGGNGIAFKWSLLDKYTLKTPYFLSGGISINHKEKLKDNNLKKCVAFDINSQFETDFGIKNITLVKEFKHFLNPIKSIKPRSR